MNDKEVMNMIQMTKRLWNFILMFSIDVVLLILYTIGVNYNIISPNMIYVLSLLGGAFLVIAINVIIVILVDRDSIVGDKNEDRVDDLTKREAKNR